MATLIVVFIRAGVTYRDRVPCTFSADFEDYAPRDQKMLVGRGADGRMTCGGWLESEIVSYAIQAEA